MSATQLPDDPYVRRVAQVPENMEIDFNRIPAVVFVANDIRNCEVTGQANAKHNFNRRNLLQSRVSDFAATEVNFSHVDFKDTSLRNATFKRCNMFGTHFNACSLSECRFEECDPSETNFNHSTFENVVFLRCRLIDILIKNCVFRNCQFVGCETNNKLFEYCLILNCEFVDTEIQVQTIEENFGLHQGQLRPFRVRSQRPREEFRYVSADEIENERLGSERDPLTRYKIAYFLYQTEDRSLACLDAAYDPAGWIARCAVVDTFCSLLQSFADFLEELYERNEICVLGILKLHDVTAKLSESTIDEHSSTGKVLFRAISGVHLQLARIVETFLKVLSDFVLYGTRSIRLLIEQLEGDPGIFLEELLYPHFKESGAAVVSVRPANSVELTINLVDTAGSIALIALLLSSRIRLEIIEIARMPKRQKLPGSTRDLSVSAPLPNVLSVTAGRLREEAVGIELRVKSILPGNLLADLRLDTDLRRLSRLTRIVKKIILYAQNSNDAAH